MTWFLICIFLVSTLKIKQRIVFEWQLSLFEKSRGIAIQGMNTMVNHSQASQKRPRSGQLSQGFRRKPGLEYGGLYGWLGVGWLLLLSTEGGQLAVTGARSDKGFSLLSIDCVRGRCWLCTFQSVVQVVQVSKLSLLGFLTLFWMRLLLFILTLECGIFPGKARLGAVAEIMGVLDHHHKSIK